MDKSKMTEFAERLAGIASGARDLNCMALIRPQDLHCGDESDQCGICLHTNALDDLSATVRDQVRALTLPDLQWKIWMEGESHPGMPTLVMAQTAGKAVTKFCEYWAANDDSCTLQNSEAPLYVWVSGIGVRWKRYEVRGREELKLTLKLLESMVAGDPWGQEGDSDG